VGGNPVVAPGGATRATPSARNMSNEHKKPWEDAILLLICLVIALTAVGVIVWVVISGRIMDLDGMLLAATCLVLILAFGGNLAWSLRTGEAQSVLASLLKRDVKKSYEKQ